MTIRNCLAAIIPVLWLSGLASDGAPRPSAHRPPHSPAAAARPIDLAGWVKLYRASPTLEHRGAVQTWAAAHPKDRPLANFALGVVAYEQRDYDSAIASLRAAARAQPAAIADYTSYYLAAARVESADLAGVAQDLAAVAQSTPPSPLAAKAWLLNARARKANDPAGAVRLLRDHYTALPQPDAAIALADCYQAAGDLPNAVDFYQRVYTQYVSGEAALRAAAALVALRDSMGTAFPPLTSKQRLERAGHLADARQYAEARAAYDAMAADLPPGLEREQAAVRAAALGYYQNQAAEALDLLNGLFPTAPEAAAERLYWIAECARHLHREDELNSAVERLAAYPASRWRLKGLITAASHYLLINRPADFVPLYRAAYQDFPDDPAAGLYHWKVAFQAYLGNQPDAANLLREHLVHYAGHHTAAAALYFFARLAQQNGDGATAADAFERLAKSCPNLYYGMLARQRLKDPNVRNKATAASAALAPLALRDAQPFPTAPTPATARRIARSRLLRAAGLSDLADAELRFGAATDAQPALAAMELAESTDAPHQAVRLLKTMVPDHLYLPLTAAPRRFWELLFPMPYRADLIGAAQASGLDPYLIAGLIRQESEFNPAALSRAKAYGLTQVVPATGKRFARRAGVPHFTPAVLFQPAANLRIGTTIFRSMLDHNAGDIESTLAAYNAGPNEVAEWLSWHQYREPAEFVESIPFSETRDYVQAVLRNADTYRRLYAAQ